MPLNLNNNEVTGVDLNNTEVSEVRLNGDTVFSAVQFTIVDDFNDTDFTEYTNSSDLQQVSGSVEGAGALQNNGNQGEVHISRPGDGLTAVPQKGEVFSWIVKDGPQSSGFFPTFAYAINSSGDGFAVRYVSITDGLRFERNKSSFDNRLSLTGASYGNGDWYEIEVEWHDGSGSEPNNTHVINTYEVDTSADLSTQLGRLSLIESKSIVDSQFQGDGISLENGDITPSGNMDIIRNHGPVQ